MSDLSLLENHLTLVCFGLMRYLEPSEGLLAWLKKARPARTGVGPLEFAPDSTIRVCFQPGTRHHGTPDILILVDSARSARAIVVEAKWGAGKSQWGPGPGEDHGVPLRRDDRPRHDQLARYWDALRHGDFTGEARLPPSLPDSSKAVVFLTPDYSPPQADLVASLREAPDMRLYWLSWRDAWAVASRTGGVSGPCELVRFDLCRLLEMAGLTLFRGFGSATSHPPVDLGERWRFSAPWGPERAARVGRVDAASWSFSAGGIMGMEEVGPNIVRAVRVVQETNRHVSDLLGALDASLAEAGMRKVKSDWVGGTATGAQVGAPKNWAMRSVHRAYLKAEDEDSPTRQGAVVEVWLEPPVGDVPIVSALVVRFGEAMTEKKFWDSWKWSDVARWVVPTAAGGLTGIFLSLDPKLLQDIVPGVESADAMLLPLCEITEDNFEGKLTEPLKKKVCSVEK